MPNLVWEEVPLEDGETGLIVTDDANTGHTIAEGCLGEIINESFGALELLTDAIEQEKPDDELEKLAVASYHMLRSELEIKLDLLETFPRKNLRPKHRDCRVILARASKVFARNSPLIEDQEFDANQYATDAVNFIKALHLCLKEDTSTAFRESVRRGYLNVATSV